MFPKKNKKINRWAAILAILFLLLFSVVLGRFYYLAQVKVVNGHELVKIGKNMWDRVFQVDAKRGTIYGRHGQILAEDIPSYTVFAVLSKKVDDHVKNKQKTARLLAPIINMEASQILDLLQKDRYRIELGPGGRKISIDQMKKIKELDLPGIGFIKTSRRYYPNQKFASYVIGFTTYNEKTKKNKGVLGIERSLNKLLSESDGKVKVLAGQENVRLSESKKILTKPDNGANVHLTLDYKIQSILETSMNKVMQEYSPKRIIGIVAKPETGEILAMANRPSFNPNKRNITNYNNYAIASPFEPGSVMKVFTLAAAINEGVWNGDATFQSGTYQVGPETIHDWNDDWGTITYRQGFIRSSNVAFSRVVDKQLGPERFYNYLKRFGFTQKTGIDLPNESDSIINYRWRVDQVMTGYGQASAFTAIQIVQAATAIANDGTMMQPYIIEKAVDPDTDKVVLNHEPEVAGHPVTKKTAQKVRELMRQVVADEKHGTGNEYQIDGYKVIGKTGTAEIAVGGKGYLSGRGNYIYSFLGMAPKKDPKVIVYIAVDRPELPPGQPESTPVKKIFKPVMKGALQYLNIKPEETKAPADIRVTLENYEGQSLSSAAKALKKQGMDVVTIGEGDVQKMIPYAGTKVLKGSRVLLVGEAPYKMPDLSGWSLADALKVAEALSLEPNIMGHGYVTDQKPAPGTTVKKGDYLVLKMETPETKEQPKETDKEDETDH